MATTPTAALTDAFRNWDTATAQVRPGHTTVPITIGDNTAAIRISEGQAERLANLLASDTAATRETRPDNHTHTRRLLDTLPDKKWAIATEAITSGQRIGEGALALCPCGKYLLYHPERLLTDRHEEICALWEQARIHRLRQGRRR